VPAIKPSCTAAVKVRQGIVTYLEIYEQVTHMTALPAK
jgi:hypothetical protein